MRIATQELVPFAVYSFMISDPEEDIETIPTLFLFVPMPGRNIRRGMYGMNINAIVDPKNRRALVGEYLRLIEVEDDKERYDALYRLFATVYRTRHHTKTAYKYYPWSRIVSGVFTRIPASSLRTLTS